MSRPDLQLNLDLCRERQRRLGKVLASRGLGAALLARPEHVQYFTGFRPPAVLFSACVIDADGTTLLCAPNQVPDYCAVHESVTFEAQWCCTLRQDQHSAALASIDSVTNGKLKGQSLGVEGSVNMLSLTPCFAKSKAQDIEPDLWDLRRRKDPDELQLIKKAIECTDAMYRRAREILAPGISELEVYTQLHAEAVSAAGEPLLAFGNDFQCNSPGGPPRTRPANAGELFILDLGVSYRGYYSDSARTFYVGSQPSDEQLSAWHALMNALSDVERIVRPGVSARQLFQEVKGQLDEVLPGAFFHHLGHGIGLSPHEAPHLNDHWEDSFREGDVFTAEPGLYAPHLRAGIRLEQNYLVTADGVERLTRTQLEL